jgi:hypothetical protein
LKSDQDHGRQIYLGKITLLFQFRQVYIALKSLLHEFEGTQWQTAKAISALLARSNH